jgi:hypothetical protein
VVQVDDEAVGGKFGGELAGDLRSLLAVFHLDVSSALCGFSEIRRLAQTGADARSGALHRMDRISRMHRMAKAC